MTEATIRALTKKPRMHPIADPDAETRDLDGDVIPLTDDPPSRSPVRSKQISYRMPAHLYAKAQELVDRGAFGSLTDLMTYAITRLIDEEYRGLVSHKEMSMELRRIVDEEMGKFMREMLEERKKSEV